MSAGREAFVGFDSAWAGNAPGGIASATFSQGRLVETRLPEPAGFDRAAAIIEELKSTHDYVLVAIDQPTVVPNQTGSRPVDRVAASLISRLGGGVQPANQGKTRSGRTMPSKVRMFGPEAPIWRFLRRIDVVQNPPQSRSAPSGRHAIEVFPALALPALEPAILERKRAARYNPANRKRFLLPDWRPLHNSLGLVIAAALNPSPETFAKPGQAAHGDDQPVAPRGSWRCIVRPSPRN